MHRYQDLDEQYSMWDGAWECHCSSDTKPWCTCDKETCRECIEENYEDDDQDFQSCKTTWKHSRHCAFGAHTDQLFATLLLGLQKLNTLGHFKPEDPMMLEEMLENWTFRDAY